MQDFLIIAVILTLIAIAFVVPPLLKKKPSSKGSSTNTQMSDVDRNAMNVSIYKERLTELEQENLTTEQLAQAKQELEKTLAQDLASAEAGISNQAGARWATSIIVAIAIPVLALGSYWKLGSWELLTQAEAQPTTQSHSNIGSESEFDEMVTKLATRLEKQPDDLQGWRMLARSYAVMGDYAKTVQTYNKIMARFGDQPDVLSDYAEFLAQSNQGKFIGLPTQLLKTALAVDSKHIKSLWLAGLAEMERLDYKAAVKHWQAVLVQLPAGETKIKKVLEGQIAKAQEHIEGNNPAPIAKPSPDVKKVSKIEVQVNLAPDLQNQLKPNDTLFIYARATTGSPMPLAILRKSASELPITVTLDDSLAMMPTKSLSSVQAVTVIARISSSGSAMLQSGDLLGKVTPVVLSEQDKVEVTINQVAP